MSNVSIHNVEVSANNVGTSDRTVSDHAVSDNTITANTSKSSSPSEYDTSYIPMMEQSSDSSSDKSLQPNIVISTPNIHENTLDIENETQLIKYLDSFDLRDTGGFLRDPSEIRHPVRFSSYYTKNDDDDIDAALDMKYMESNSPVSMSPCGSDDEGSVGPLLQQQALQQNRGAKKFKRLTYADVEKSIEKYYNPNQKFSNEFDILVTYLKGQKNLYIQSKNLTQTKLNLLVFPSIVFTAFITVFAPTMDMGETSVYIISAVNAVIAVLVGLINYLKLESKTETYSQLAAQYDKLETMIELSSNKLFFMAKESDQTELILNKIKYIENKLNDIKEMNYVIIPEEVKKVFPIISHINIFSFIKKIETYKKKLIMQFKDVKNEIGYIIYKWNSLSIDIFQDSSTLATHSLRLSGLNDTKNMDAHLKTQFVKEQTRLMYLLQMKEKIKYELIYYKNSYGQIDELFIREIKGAESYLVWIRSILCGEYKRPYLLERNPVIDEFLKILY